MSTEFSNQLTALLDDVAASISPRADFAAARAGAAEMKLAPTSTGGNRPFRGLALVAALVLLVTGAVFAYHRATGDPDSLSTASDVTMPTSRPLTTFEPGTTGDGSVAGRGDGLVQSSNGTVPSAAVEYVGDDRHSAEVVSVDFDGEPPVVVLHGRAPDGEVVRVFSLAGVVEVTAEGGTWEAHLELTGLDAITAHKLLIEVGYGDGAPAKLVWIELPKDEPKDEPVAEEPKEEPPPKEEPKHDPPPVAVAFTAVIDGSHWDYEPPKVHLAGTAQPGSKVIATFQYGEQHVVADQNGKWAMWFKLWEIGPGQTAHIRVTSRASEKVFEFDATVPAAPPAQVAFTAAAVEGVHEGDPIWHRFSGTAQPGSGVLASSEYGAADVAVGPSGEWTLKLWMNDVPAGATFKVRLTNSVSGEVFDFWLEKPAAPPPPVVEFTANAAYTTCNLDPPYNDFWGTAQPGTVVTILSPYGGAELTVGAGGGWEKRVYFPDAPLGETFTVKVKSVATGQFVEFPFTKVAAG